MNIQVNKCQKTLTNLQQNFEENDGVWNKFNDVIQNFIKIMKIKSCLDSQDEFDKHSISLWGMHERSVQGSECKSPSSKNLRGDKINQLNKIHKGPFKQSNVIKLDKQCYS